MKKWLKVLGWVLIVGSVLILGLPLALHVAHLGLAIIKLVIEAVVFGVVFSLGVYTVKHS